MAQRNLRASVGSGDSGTTALNLVHRAAEVFRSMEDHAREIEDRAQSLCKSALERLEHAEGGLKPLSERAVNSSLRSNANCRTRLEL
jgi:hypothetical protein